MGAWTRRLLDPAVQVPLNYALTPIFFGITSGALYGGITGMMMNMGGTLELQQRVLRHSTLFGTMHTETAPCSSMHKSRLHGGSLWSCRCCQIVAVGRARRHEHPDDQRLCRRTGPRVSQYAFSVTFLRPLIGEYC